MGKGFEFDKDSSPYDIINGIINIGKEKYINLLTNDEVLLLEIQNELILDNLNTAHLTLNEFRQAIDTLQLDPKMYFEIGQKTGKIGTQLTLLDHNRLRIAYELYETYKDPRHRDDR